MLPIVNDTSDKMINSDQNTLYKARELLGVVEY